jgi:hypothetical protein
VPIAAVLVFRSMLMMCCELTFRLRACSENIPSVTSIPPLFPPSVMSVFGQSITAPGLTTWLLWTSHVPESEQLHAVPVQLKLQAAFAAGTLASNATATAAAIRPVRLADPTAMSASSRRSQEAGSPRRESSGDAALTSESPARGLAQLAFARQVPSKRFRCRIGKRRDAARPTLTDRMAVVCVRGRKSSLVEIGGRRRCRAVTKGYALVLGGSFQNRRRHPRVAILE